MRANIWQAARLLQSCSFLKHCHVLVLLSAVFVLLLLLLLLLLTRASSQAVA
jgi:hypothetical protein